MEVFEEEAVTMLGYTASASAVGGRANMIPTRDLKTRHRVCSFGHRYQAYMLTLQTTHFKLFAYTLFGCTSRATGTIHATRRNETADATHAHQFSQFPISHLSSLGASAHFTVYSSPYPPQSPQYSYDHSDSPQPHT
jgi:hypothetical protein